jgi:hypoxanthine phosphoribosyltransferase
MDEMRRELISWEEVDRLIDQLLPQFETEFEGMMLITRGGIVPGGLLAEALNITHILTAAIDFPANLELQRTGLFAWPRFLQFPEDELVRGRRILAVDDVWGSGRTITTVKNRIMAGGGFPYTCVLHFNPYRNLLGNARPDYYAAITDAHVVYPWEIARGGDKVLLQRGGVG